MVPFLKSKMVRRVMTAPYLPLSLIGLLRKTGFYSKQGKPTQVSKQQPLPIGWKPSQSARAISSPFLSRESTWKAQVLSISAPFPERSGRQLRGVTGNILCDLNDYRAQIRPHLNISGWPPRHARGRSNCHVPPADMNSTPSSLTTEGKWRDRIVTKLKLSETRPGWLDVSSPSEPGSWTSGNSDAAPNLSVRMDTSLMESLTDGGQRGHLTPKTSSPLEGRNQAHAAANPAPTT